VTVIIIFYLLIGLLGVAQSTFIVLPAAHEDRLAGRTGWAVGLTIAGLFQLVVSLFVIVGSILVLAGALS